MAKGKTIAAYTYQQTASNAPTQEIAGQDTGPVPVYTSPPPPRSREHREPQLWWHSKEPAEGWSQPAPRLYTQEKIVPQQYVESLLRSDQQGLAPDLFARLNGLTAEQYYEPYSHQGNWLNRLIRGESTQVMASLLEHEGMAGSVQMVYFDPPYGIGFDSNFQSLTGRLGARKGAQQDVETVKAFRDRYNNGLHSYMDSLHRNLMLARELLDDSGHVFVQIGSEHMGEVLLTTQRAFGKENRVSVIPFATKIGLAPKGFADDTSFIIWFAKNLKKGLESYNQLYQNTGPEIARSRVHGLKVEEISGKIRPLKVKEAEDLTKLPEGARVFEPRSITSMGIRKGRTDPYKWNGIEYKPSHGTGLYSWRISIEGLDNLAKNDRLYANGNTLNYKCYIDEIPGTQLPNIWAKPMPASNKIYAVQTSTEVIERCLLMSTKPGDLVLDLTCGSGTTAFVAEQWGRRWITTDTSAVPVALTRQRIATSTHPYHFLQDSPEGAAKEQEMGGTPLPDASGRDPAKDFVYKRSKKVTAAILAYDREPERVLLVNQPEIDATKIRVSAPFCVQNANATAWLPITDRYDDTEASTGEAQLTTQRLENALTTAGIKYSNGTAGKRIQVQNLRAYGERIKLDDQSEVDGITRGYITHTADVIMPSDDTNAKAERAALAIVGFHRRVAGTFTNHAVMEANEMPGVKHLIVIGFEFEAAINRGRHKRGQLNVVQAQANTDLAIDTLEDSANDDAFVMLGEPELKVNKSKDGKYTVEVTGFMTHDPETGNMRSAGPEEIHCWMLDSDYDCKSFMCRELHFMNARDKQLQRLQRALGSLLDPSSWDTMIGTMSKAFDEPTNNEHLIAVRIVTTAGVELTAIRDVTKC